MEFASQNIKNWIFDMDGTLTVACHDFEAIRAQLGLPAGLPILEQIAQLPPQRAEKLHQQLYEIELEVAALAQPQPDAEELLATLQKLGHKVGILTRNSLEIAFATLNACGLSSYIESENILGRESCAPKPDPEGVNQLMRKWDCKPVQTVMVGDYVFDLQSGHAAGVHTVHFDVLGLYDWPEVTHFKISNFKELFHLL